MKFYVLFTKGVSLNISNGLSIKCVITDNIADNLFISAVEEQLELFMLQGQSECSADCR
jgi:hypothetical protein